ncbi:hypothetical protein SB00610_05207 [Klebsiella quasipneumoniae subsp. similipneumoniae]|nr:hypothetical protein SB00610_05207 [Klebsiella quasipneumoniae subsp. similipneumoniae]
MFSEIHNRVYYTLTFTAGVTLYWLIANERDLPEAHSYSPLKRIMQNNFDNIRRIGFGDTKGPDMRFNIVDN